MNLNDFVGLIPYIAVLAVCLAATALGLAVGELIIAIKAKKERDNESED